jgi:lambda family phage portal protein
LGYIPRDEIARRPRRSYAAAGLKNILNDWSTAVTAIDQDIRTGLNPVRQRARDLAQNNDYAKAYLRLLRTNVAGPSGFALQIKSDPALPEQKLRELMNAWYRWTAPANCTVTGRQSWRAVQHLLITSAGRDGEGALHFILDDNAYCGLRLQVLPAELVDESYTMKLGTNRYIKMGVEVTGDGRVLGYHLRDQETVDNYGAVLGSQRRRYVSADQMILGYDQEFPNQTRGISWLVQSMVRLKMLSGYEEAAVVNARVSAAKMGFIVKKDMAAPQYAGDTEDADGNKITSVEPGTVEELDYGQEFQPWSPEYPSAQHEMFVTSNLRGVSSGLGVAAASLSGNFSDVNYSSARAALLIERDHYMTLQNWMVETFLEPVFAKWLEGAVMTGAVKLKPSEMEAVYPSFVGKRWAWVDPRADVEAKQTEVRSGFTAPSLVVAEQGKDYEELLQQIALDKLLAAKYGVPLDFGGTAPAVQPDSDDGDDRLFGQRKNGHKVK